MPIPTGSTGGSTICSCVPRKHSKCAPEEITFHRTIDMRYRGQVHQLPVPLTAGALSAAQLADATERFHGIYTAAYGVDARGPVQFVTYRVRAVREVEKPVPARQPGAAHIPEQSSRRDVYVVESGAFTDTPVYLWEELTPGAQIAGPAIVEGAATSVVLPPGWHATVDPLRNIVLAQ